MKKPKRPETEFYPPPKYVVKPQPDDKIHQFMEEELKKNHKEKNEKNKTNSR